jgi:hypothetical protein
VTGGGGTEESTSLPLKVVLIGPVGAGVHEHNVGELAYGAFWELPRFLIRRLPEPLLRSSLASLGGGIGAVLVLQNGSSTMPRTNGAALRTRLKVGNFGLGVVETPVKLCEMVGVIGACFVSNSNGGKLKLSAMSFLERFLETGVLFTAE